MRLLEKIIKRNISRYLNEWDWRHYPESKNVEDRRNEGFLDKYDLQSLNLCRKLRPELLRLKQLGKDVEFFKNAEKFFWFGGRTEWSYAYRLGNVLWEFPNSGNDEEDFVAVNEYLANYPVYHRKDGARGSERIRIPLCNDKNLGVPDWITSLEYHLNRALPKQNDVMQKNCTRDGTVIRRAARR